MEFLMQYAVALLMPLNKMGYVVVVRIGFRFQMMVIVTLVAAVHLPRVALQAERCISGSTAH